MERSVSTHGALNQRLPAFQMAHEPFAGRQSRMEEGAVQFVRVDAMSSKAIVTLAAGAPLSPRYESFSARAVSSGGKHESPALTYAAPHS